MGNDTKNVSRQVCSFREPVFDPLPHLKEAILLYKHKSRKKVIEKELELKPYCSTIVYTGGIRGDKANEYTFVL